MASYLTRLESMIERWQSRRKTIEISSSGAHQLTMVEKPAAAANQEDAEKATKRKMISRKFVRNHREQREEGDDNKENQLQKCEPEQNIVMRAPNKQQQQVTASELACTTRCPSITSSSAAMTSLLYALNISFFISLALLGAQATEPAAEIRGPVTIKTAAAPITMAIARTAGREARNLGLSFIEQLTSSGTRSRWTMVPGDGPDPLGVGHSDRQPGRWAQRASALQRLVNRISARIGARNSIRVHNAFRDFAWRILSSLSMPTPVIYELRRQHMYSPEDDQMNDSLFNRNTTKTIRTRRLLALKAPSNDRNDNLASRASNEDDEEDEPDNLVERIRSRLDDLVSLSRRSLFGRVIRVPSLFPFKRQEGEEEQELRKGAASIVAGSRRRRLYRKKRKKDADRQMISINGKQYYVNDNGELKELESTDSTD